jgi:Aspartyl/Asparaginyl beta-hydroxylase
MFDFKIKKLDNIQFSVNELLDYYNEVETNFQQLKWTVDSALPEDREAFLRSKTNNDPTIASFGYAIQSRYAHDKPCPPYSWGDVQLDYDKSTSLMFGFANKILERFPFSRQLVIGALPPNSGCPLHVDPDCESTGEQTIRVHIPIKTNDNVFFTVSDTVLNMKVGNAYIVNTLLPHRVENLGNDFRIHLVFKVPISQVNRFISTSYVL